jgi:hypothetical protein
MFAMRRECDRLANKIQRGLVRMSGCENGVNK